MNFKPHLADLAMDGTKTQTRRRLSTKPRSPWFADSCTFRPGQRFAVCPGRSKPNIGHAIVDSVAKVRLGDITQADARAEGCRDIAHFLKTWNAINGTPDPDELVWCVTFHAEPSPAP